MSTAWAQARCRAHAAPSPLPPTVLALAAAAGATLAAPLRAATPVPGVDCSAMDGYAVGSPAGPWQVVGRVLAGHRPTAPVRPGEAVEVATGAPVPAGTAAVVPYELVQRTGNRLDAGDPPGPGRNVRRVGEDVPLGVDLLPVGSAVTPTVVGLAAAAGLDALTVHPRARVAALLTGDELVYAGGSAGPLVRDAVGPALPGWIRALGGDPLPAEPVPDTDAGTLAAALAAADGDVVITSGGAGAGPADLVGPALDRLGARLVVDGVECRPGRPQRLAALPDGRWLVALPGNPYAALVAALTLLGPLLTGIAGRPLPELPTAVLTDVESRRGAGALTRVIPVRHAAAGAVESLGRDRPGNLWGPALADAFAVVPPGWRDGQVALLAPPG